MENTRSGKTWTKLISDRLLSRLDDGFRVIVEVLARLIHLRVGAYVALIGAADMTGRSRCLCAPQRWCDQQRQLHRADVGGGMSDQLGKEEHFPHGVDVGLIVDGQRLSETPRPGGHHQLLDGTVVTAFPGKGRTSYALRRQ